MRNFLLTWMVSLIINLISGTHHLCEKGITYLFVVLYYWIITRIIITNQCRNWMLNQSKVILGKLQVFIRTRL